MFYNGQLVQQNINTFNSYISGDNTLFDLSLNWGLSFAQSKSETPMDYQVQFQESSNTLDSITHQPIAGMKGYPVSLNHGPIQSITSEAFNNYSHAYFYDAFNRGAKNYTKGNSYYLNVTKSYNLLEFLAGEFKIGGSYKTNIKFRDSSEYIAPYYLNNIPGYTRLANGTIVPKDYSGTRFYGMPTKANSTPATYFMDGVSNRSIFGLYDLNPLLSRDALQQWHDLSVNGFPTWMVRTGIQRKYCPECRQL